MGWERSTIRRNVDTRLIPCELTNVRRNVKKTRLIVLYRQTEVRRNAEKIGQILYKRTNVRRNAEEIRQILYKRTNVWRNVEKIRRTFLRTLVRLICTNELTYGETSRR